MKSYDALDNFKGDKLIYIGETSRGATGNEVTHHIIRTKWKIVSKTLIEHRFPFAKNYLFLLEKRRELHNVLTAKLTGANLVIDKGEDESYGLQMHTVLSDTTDEKGNRRLKLGIDNSPSIDGCYNIFSGNEYTTKLIHEGINYAIVSQETVYAHGCPFFNITIQHPTTKERKIVTVNPLMSNSEIKLDGQNIEPSSICLDRGDEIVIDKSDNVCMNGELIKDPCDNIFVYLKRDDKKNPKDVRC